MMRLSEVKQVLNKKYRENLDVLKKVTCATEGQLFVRRKNGRTSYYCRKNKEDKNGTYVSSMNKVELRELEQNNYNRILRKTAAENIKVLDKAQKCLDKVIELDDVYSNIAEEMRNLIIPYGLEQVDEKMVSKWLERRFDTQLDKSKAPYKVSNGISVRSKSELIIAERLISFGVPFMYEQPTRIDRVDIWFPDFLVLNKRTKQEYYWEHFGMISDSQYSVNMQSKIEVYAENGIVIGKNLIVSMESTQHPLDTEYIDTMIKQFLL